MRPPAAAPPSERGRGLYSAVHSRRPAPHGRSVTGPASGSNVHQRRAQLAGAVERSEVTKRSTTVTALASSFVSPTSGRGSATKPSRFGIFTGREEQRTAFVLAAVGHHRIVASGRSARTGSLQAPGIFER